LKLSHAGLDWLCHRANSLGRFVAHRARISVASDASYSCSCSYSYSAKRYSYSYSMAARWLLKPQRAAIVRSDRSPWSNRPAVCGPSGQDIGSKRRSPRRYPGPGGPMRSAQSCAAFVENTRDISRGALERVEIETSAHLESTDKSPMGLGKVH
jgi:hypothetical protein